MYKKYVSISVVVLMLGGLAPQAFAEDAPIEKPVAEIIKNGIRTDFGDVLVENLGIGQSYNLRELAGTPLKVTNTGDKTIDLIIDVTIPPETMIGGKRKELGYKPVPSATWVKLSQSQFVVPPKESAYTDVIIEIPNDPSLFGKKFQASIYSRTSGKNLVQVGVWSHLLFTILPDKAAQEDMEKRRRHGATAAEYTLLPDKLEIQNAPLGKRIDIAKYIKRTIKIANSGTAPLKLRVQSVRIGDTPLNLQSGFEEPNINWLQIENQEITVAPDSFGDPGFTLELPNNPSLKKKQFMFVIKVEPADDDVVGVTFYGKIYVITE